jgi:hypothetical protein
MIDRHTGAEADFQNAVVGCNLKKLARADTASGIQARHNTAAQPARAGQTCASKRIS